MLVSQYFSGKLEGLEAPHVAAFLSGWSGALDLLRRFELTLPNADPETRGELLSAVEAVESAQRIAFADPDESHA